MQRLGLVEDVWKAWSNMIRERERERERERMMIKGDILYEEKIQEYLGGLRLALNQIGSE